MSTEGWGTKVREEQLYNSMVQATADCNTRVSTVTGAGNSGL